ncbi:hypothetical protein [Lysobacter sp. FW306-1B-D06B]|uniref:hypothetical protein n=1 Tax=Lysobacter sp. FW306-1B-D06B TaxID=3140250 RepID=UPI00314066A1
MKGPYYLPLTQRSAKSFVEEGKAFDEPIEAAAMFAALTRIKRGTHSVHLGHLVADAFHPFRKEPLDGHTLLAAALHELEVSTFDDFTSKLRDLGHVWFYQSEFKAMTG